MTPTKLSEGGERRGTHICEGACVEFGCKSQRPNDRSGPAERRRPEWAETRRNLVIGGSVPWVAQIILSLRRPAAATREFEEALTAYGKCEFEGGQVSQTGSVPKWLRDATRAARARVVAIFTDMQAQLREAKGRDEYTNAAVALAEGLSDDLDPSEFDDLGAPAWANRLRSFAAARAARSKGEGK